MQERDNQYSGSITFSGSNENVYSRYLHATYVRQNRLVWLLVSLVTIPFILFYLEIALHPGDYWGEAYLERVGRDTIRTRYHSKLMVPVSYPAIPFLLALGLFFLIPQFRWGLQFANFAWPRLYGWVCGRDTRRKFINAKKTYFDSYKRCPDKAKLERSSITIYQPDDSTRKIPYAQIARAFRQHKLVILQVGHSLLPDDEVVLELQEIPRIERRKLLDFIDSRLPETCKCYYRRRMRQKEALRYCIKTTFERIRKRT